MMISTTKAILRSGRTALQRSLSSMPAVADVVDTWRNPAAIMHGINDLRFEDFPLAANVAYGLVRVQMKSVGICGSDVHFLQKVRNIPGRACTNREWNKQTLFMLQGRIGHFEVKAPMVLGHECAGWVSLICLHSFASVRTA